MLMSVTFWLCVPFTLPKNERRELESVSDAVVKLPESTSWFLSFGTV